MIVNKFPFYRGSGAHIYGVSWNGTSTTLWTRTDKSANFSDPVPYVLGASSYGSPFDNLYPWSDMTIVEDSAAGTMVKIPKFWYKLTQNGAGMSIQISDAALEGYSVCPACMDRGDGKGERDYILVGRYHCASTYKSTTGVKPAVSKTRSAFRTGIQGLGTGVYMMDWATRFTLFLLYLVEYANWNSQATIGYGCGNNRATQNMGYTDSMPYHTGTTLSARTSYGLGTQYRYIEGLLDNVFDWIDGCYNNSSGLMLILNPSKFSDSANGTSVGTPSDGFPSAFSVKTVNNTFPLFISSAASGSNTTYSCDRWIFRASDPCVQAGCTYQQNLNGGLFFFHCGGKSSTYSYTGSRPMKLPDFSNGGGNVTLISFTIAGTSYQAESGMTWAEWVASTYNTDGFSVLSSGEVLTSSRAYKVSNVTASSIIQENSAYSLARYVSPW